MGWNRLGFNLIEEMPNALCKRTCLWSKRIMVKRVESALQLLDQDTEYFNMGFEFTARVLVLHRNFSWVPTYFGREVTSMEGHGITLGKPLLRVCVIWMVCASLCSRPCFISRFVGRYVESYYVSPCAL